MKSRQAAPTTIVLFTCDLRVHDNPSLAEAAETGGEVIPLFVLDNRILRQSAPNRTRFLLEALADLRQSLAERGAGLVLRRGDPVEETCRLARERNAQIVYVAEDVSSYARRREDRLRSECNRARLELRIADTTSVVPPRIVAPAQRTHYRIFTPYWRRWREVPLQPPTPAPVRLRMPDGIASLNLPSLSALIPAAPSSEVVRGGEREARGRLRRWLRDGLQAYERVGDQLDRAGTSRLGAYLHFGCLSAREVVDRAREHPNAEAFVRQLCWRDFFHQLLAANPTSAHSDLRDRAIAWRHDDEALARWRAGLTGYPIVDAGMRQLFHEGWLPNRARLIVASFLTKTLGLHWRLGAAAFSDFLVDGDLASNVGNWQWVAGTGADTRPNRILNPITQARRFDPEGAYVRRWVPELAGLEGVRIHEPWKAKTSLLAPEYPVRVVDHASVAGRFRPSRDRHANRA